jgi:hypothetical protein
MVSLYDVYLKLFLGRLISGVNWAKWLRFQGLLQALHCIFQLASTG